MDLAVVDLREIPWFPIMDLSVSHPGIILTDIQWDQPQEPQQ